MGQTAKQDQPLPSDTEAIGRRQPLFEDNPIMRYFEVIETVAIAPALLKKAQHFATRVAPTVGIPGQGYSDTQQTNRLKIKHDHFISKVGEEAVRIAFERYGQVVVGPDYQIYSRLQKSWAADLYIAGVGLAVKTQTTAAAQQFGRSWTFQAGPHRCDPILQEPMAWVCFVEIFVETDEDSAQCWVYPPYQIKDLTFSEPKLKRLRGCKKVVYADRLGVLPHGGSVQS